jgi:hypothetical protein
VPPRRDDAAGPENLGAQGFGARARDGRAAMGGNLRARGRALPTVTTPDYLPPCSGRARSRQVAPQAETCVRWFSSSSAPCNQSRSGESQGRHQHGNYHDAFTCSGAAALDFHLLCPAPPRGTGARSRSDRDHHVTVLPMTPAAEPSPT